MSSGAALKEKVSTGEEGTPGVLVVVAVVFLLAVFGGLWALYAHTAASSLKPGTPGVATVTQTPVKCSQVGQPSRVECEVRVTVAPSTGDDTHVTAVLTQEGQFGWAQQFPVWKTSQGWVTTEPTVSSTLGFLAAGTAAVVAVFSVAATRAAASGDWWAGFLLFGAAALCAVLPLPFIYGV